MSGFEITPERVLEWLNPSGVDGDWRNKPADQSFTGLALAHAYLDAMAALAEAERRGAEKGWDEGWLARPNARLVDEVQYLYDHPNPYRADRIAQDQPCP